jgi:hypothetical protein
MGGPFWQQQLKFIFRLHPRLLQASQTSTETWKSAFAYGSSIFCAFSR